jgi:hypothetical protein
MSASYTIKPIAADSIDRAYSLIRAVAPDLSLHEWRQFCRNRAEEEETILALNASGYVKGLCIFSVREHGRYGRLLDAPVFVVASAADAEGVGAELLRCLEETRERRACSGVRLWTMGADAWDRRLSPDDIGRSDHGIILPAAASADQLEAVLAACIRAGPTLSDRASR